LYKNITLSASLINIDWLNVRSQLSELEHASLDYLHIDVIDGNFVPDFTMGTSIINLIRKSTTLPFDYHFMAEEPSRLFDSFQVNKTDYFTIHQETSRNLHRDLVRIKKDKSSKVGVALTLETPIDALEYIMEDVDLIVLMTMNVGYIEKQQYPQVVKKVQKLRKLITEHELPIKIAVDCNISFENISEMVSSGADFLVLGSNVLFREDMSIGACMELLHAEIDQGLS
jgi:ribulose-phosphate 3-epimerase